MAKAGYRTVLACRNEGKANVAMCRMKKRVRKGSFEILVLDLGDFDVIRSAAETFRSKHDHLDVLINNAGVLDYYGQMAKNGYEIQLMTNHLGHMLFTSILLDLMPDSPASQIVLLSSVAHKGAHIHFDDNYCVEASDKGAAYGQSKLACLLFGDELNRRLQRAGRKKISLVVRPGGSDSGLVVDMSRIQYAVLKILAPFITHSNASAAKPSLCAALSIDIEGGDYCGPQRVMELRGKIGTAKRASSARDATVAARRWDVSEELIGENFTI